MQSSRPNWASSIGGRRCRLSLGAGIAAAVLVSGASQTQNAVANGDTRTLSIYHTHSKETATITFKRHGTYDRAGLDQLNHVLRDWRTHDQTKMDPRLFDVVWEVHREVGSREAIHIVSAYRAPATNAMLHRRSRGVAKHSQHTLGKAMDFSLPDVPMDKVRAVGMRLQRGGVGYYPSSNPFVHLDVGSVRSWPRMTPDQLARLFPDGKTVHLPTDGKPLAGYELAKAEIMSRGGAVSGYAAYADAGQDVGPNPLKSFFASLLGGGADEAEDTQVEKPAAAATRVAARSASLGASTQAPVAASLAGLAPSASPVPLPVARPSFDAAEPTQFALAPLPPRRPDELAAAFTLANVPLPPSRPVEIAALVPLKPSSGADEATDTLAALAAASLDQASRKPDALAYAPFDRPLPANRPLPGGKTAAAALAERIAMVHANSPAYASDNALRPLFATSVTGSLPSEQARISTARTHVERLPMGDLPRTPEPIIAQRGFVKSVARISHDRFSTASAGSGFGFQ